MNWLYGIRNKMQVGALLLVILGLILWNNLEERRQSKALQTHFDAIFADRLLAESYLFEISEKLHEKSMLFLQKEEGQAVLFENIDKTIHTLLAKYEKTKLTEREEALYADFKMEFDFSKADEPEGAAEATLKALRQLNALSNLQVTEGEKLIHETKRIFLKKKSASQFEMTILIVIALLIQVLIFSSQTLLSRMEQKPHLN
ncbi:MCP four helix bundle domain-containing protein [Marinilongibacter aquaticus]|uniref:MCP four helix bundle domain-containing protein n=1 Tax=Marinilongibacter aquaticus TaxID=2975157 RepID=UPI0021BD691C|nr:MCP four helix bundle domain-containing protein [Marinilongibacter aquaticus]UBM59872.1 MCP four helix bundle domain-containing protein [Marinilongibacter aquaticus]